MDAGTVAVRTDTEIEAVDPSLSGMLQPIHRVPIVSVAEAPTEPHAKLDSCWGTFQEFPRPVDGGESDEHGQTSAPREAYVLAANVQAGLGQGTPAW